MNERMTDVVLKAVDPRIGIHAIVDAINWEHRPERAIGVMTMLEAMLDQDHCDKEEIEQQVGMKEGWADTNMSDKGAFSDYGDLTNDPLDIDALKEQVREEPNRELVHQHDEGRDPLDLAIVIENELVEEEVADEVVREELVDLVRERVEDEWPRE